MPRGTQPILEADTDERLTALLTADSYNPSTKYERADPILPHWSCREAILYSRWEGNWTYRPTFAYY